MKFIFTLPDILEHSATVHPDKIAIIDGSRNISYRDLNVQSNALAHYLISRGIKKGDRIGIFLDKSIETVISIWGISKAGGIFINIDPRLTSEQVSYCIENCNMRCVITSDRKKDAVKENEKFFILNFNEFNSIFKEYPGHSVRDVRLIEEDLVAILYTSGSTGLPKGVILSHKNLVLGAKIVVTYLENTENDIILSVLPFNFDYGLNQLLTAFLVGARLVLQKSMFPNDICKALIEQRVTGFAGVPSIWIMLLQPICSFKNLKFPDLRYITNSGGQIPVAYVNELRQVLKNTKIYLMYGLTEAFRSTYLPPDELSQRPTSIGKAILNVQIAVINKEGKECQVDEEGQLVHRGGVIFRGYWNDPEATAKVLRPWPLTPKEVCTDEMAVWSGDIVKKDKEGFLYFIGRDDEMMKCLGYRISPQEVEDVLYKIEQIKEVVVFGIKDDMLGHKIKSVISFKENVQTISKNEIVAFCKKYLPDYMIPQEIELVVDLPKTSTGKIDRAKVKKEYGQ